MRTRSSIAVALAFSTTVVLSLSGCGPQQAPASSVTNASLRVHISPLPENLKVVANTGAVLELAPAADAQGTSKISFSVGPLNDSPNLVAAMKADQQRIQGLQGGEYKGGQELVTPNGPAFYSRGRYVVDGSTVEETRVFMLHPGGERMLTVSYTYPGDSDSASRVTQLLQLVAQVEVAPSTG